MTKTFTFKDNQPTGRWRSFGNLQIDVKFGGKVCGSIHEILSNEWKIMLMVKLPESEVTPQKPCPWKWVTLKHRPTSKVEAKVFLKAHCEGLMKQFDLYFQEE